MAAERLFEAIEAVAAQLLPPHDMDTDALRETAGRVAGLLERVRQIDEAALADLVPAFAYQPAHVTYRGRPAAPDAVVEAAGGAGVTGYGGNLGGAGAAGTFVAGGAEAVEAEDELAHMSLVEQAEAVRTRAVSAEELVGAAIARAEGLNPRLNAFITLTAESALAAAREADRLLAADGPRGPLHGVPVAHKDILLTRGVPTTAGSVIFAGYVPDRDAAAVRRLADAGAVMIGKTNTHQFAFGATTESSHVGPARNPRDVRRSPGGSSGGSGAAVAARIVACATGTDTGGSIRIPAAACGVFGLKPTYGRVSKAGVFPLSWSLDHVGPLTRSAADAALVLGVLAGPDPEDPTAAAAPVGDYLNAAQRGAEEGVSGLRVGVLAAWLEDRVDAGIRRAVTAAADRLREAGAEVQECTFLAPGVLTLINRLIALSEAASYHGPILSRHRAGYLPDVRARMELGQFLLARDYLLAQRLRTEVTRRLNAVLERFDVLLAPTLPIGAPLLGQGTVDWAGAPEPVPDAMIRLTAPFNVTGHPAAAVPFGRAEDGMPASVQIVGRPFAEATVLRVAAALEAARA